MNSGNGTDGKSLAIGLLIGVAVGVAIGYLTAPKSGRETRELIQEKSEELKEKASGALAKVRDAACSGMGATKEA